MGILTRRQADLFVITSDGLQGLVAKRAPRRVNGPYQVWTGDNWSANTDQALTFASLDEADEYVRANYAKVSA